MFPISTDRWASICVLVTCAIIIFHLSHFIISQLSFCLKLLSSFSYSNNLSKFCWVQELHLSAAPWPDGQMAGPHALEHCLCPPHNCTHTGSLLSVCCRTFAAATFMTTTTKRTQRASGLQSDWLTAWLADGLGPLWLERHFIKVYDCALARHTHTVCGHTSLVCILIPRIRSVFGGCFFKLFNFSNWKVLKKKSAILCFLAWKLMTFSDTQMLSYELKNGKDANALEGGCSD